MPPWIIRVAASLVATFAVCSDSPAQTCTIGPRVPYTGHSLPLTSSAVPTPMTLVSTYPNLTLNRPVVLAFAPDGSARAVVAEQSGVVRLLPLDRNSASTSVYLDLVADVLFDASEQGLLGLAFDPQFATNHFLYVSYTSGGARCVAGPYCTKVVRYTQSAANANQVDVASRRPIIEYPRPAVVHNAGAIAFGRDGMLYVSSGDGGASYEGQNRAKLLGVMLRIDVHGASPYVIPPDNPFVGQAGVRGEIFAYGLRNAWRFSFDRQTGDLWLGDVGESTWEEIDFVSAASHGGQNFGWYYCEGAHNHGSFNCASIVSTPPVLEYGHNAAGGYSVTGGYVYRGDRLASLFGAYVYADWVSGSIWARSPTTLVSTKIATQSQIASFAEDGVGELYLVSLLGKIYTLQPTTGGGQPWPTTLSATQLFASVGSLTVAPGVYEYEVNAPLWSDYAVKRRWLALPAGKSIGFSADGDWSFPLGTALVKHFELPTSATTRRRVETRVLLQQTDRWVGYTYRWNAAGTDATLLTDALDEVFTVDTGTGPRQQTWHYPSPAECLGCHTDASGRVLGVRTAQLHRSFPYVSGADDQLHAWGKCLGLFQPEIASPSSYASYADPANTAETIDARARSYLAANCAHCHQPGGPAPGALDLRYLPLLGGMNLIGVTPTEGNLGVTGAQRVRVGNRAQSILWLRVQSTDLAVHMARGSRVPDPLAVSLLGTWIDSGLGTIDSDDDGVPDGSDNCRYESNPSQSDGGRWLLSSADGVGDACQCANSDALGTVNAADLVALRGTLAGALAGVDRRASYPDPAGRACALDVVHLRRALAGLEPPPAQVCPAATRLRP